MKFRPRSFRWGLRVVAAPGMQLASSVILGMALGGFAGCGTGAAVDRYAPCVASDTCPTGTVCESATSSSASSTTALEANFCTHSCTTSADCPSDASGRPGVCGSSMGSYRFCFQPCASGTCPTGETCTPTGSVDLCVPTLQDPLSQTSWQSTTISPDAQNNFVTSSTYTVTFGAGTVDSGTYGYGMGVTGAFSATLVQTYSASNRVSPDHQGCTETTTMTGATWVETLTSSAGGTLVITGGTSSTTSTGCTVPSSDVTESGYYLPAVEAHSPYDTGFTASGTMLRASDLSPYDGTPDEYVFTRVD